MKLKKLFSTILSISMLSAMVPVMASEPNPESGKFWFGFNNGTDYVTSWNDNYMSVEWNDEPDYINEGEGSLKCTVNHEVARANSVRRTAVLFYKDVDLLETGKAVKALVMDVYAENASVGNYLFLNYVGENGTKGSVSVAGGWNSGQSTESQVVRCARRVLKEGWNTVSFDITNATKIVDMQWVGEFNSEAKSEYSESVIYLDNVRVVYQDVNGVVDTFDKYDDDWYGPNDSIDGANLFNLSQNTNPAYIKEGNGSMKVTATRAADTTAFRSVLWNGWKDEQVGGKLIPYIDGYTPESFSMWVYNDTGSGISLFFLDTNYAEEGVAINVQGWRKVEFSLKDKSALFAFKIKTMSAGDVYFDDLRVKYKKNEELDNETFWFGFEGSNENFISWNEDVLTLSHAEDGICTQGGAALKATVNNAAARANGIVAVLFKINRDIPQPPSGKIAKRILFDVYVDDNLATNYLFAEHRAQLADKKIVAVQGSAFVKESTQRQFVKGAERTLSNGWNTVSFDITNGVKFDYLFWRADFNSDAKSDVESSVIYIDNVRIVYEDMNSPMESLDNLDDCYGPNDSIDGANFYNLSLNTNPDYITEGTGSMCVNVTSAGKTKNTNAIRTSNYSNNAFYGEVIPYFEEAPAKNLYIDVYNDTGSEAIITWDGEQYTLKEKNGWNKVKFPINGHEAVMQFAIYAPGGGNLYFDNMTVEYDIPYSISTSLLNGSGELGAIKNGDTINFALNIKGNDGRAADYSVILGVYDVTGKLVGIDTENVIIPEGQIGAINANASCVIADADTIWKVKGFVWNNLSEMIPVNDLYKVKVYE